MIGLVKQRPLGAAARRFSVRYAIEALPEFAERDDAEDLMDEVERVLSQDPIDPPGHRSEKITGQAPLRRYRPHTDNGCRVFYAVEQDEVWILGVHPRKTAYRDSNLRAASERLRKVVGRS